MQKRVISLLILLVLLLSACTPKEVNTSDESPTPESLVATDTAEATDLTGTEEQAAQPIVASGPAECRTASLFSDEELSALPEITDADWILGNADAPVTILEYSDLQCPYCALFEPALVSYVTAHPEKVRLVFRHFPLNIHANASMAAVMVEAAGVQGIEKFEALKNTLFEKQAEWSSLDADAFLNYGMDLAATLDIDVEQLAADMESDEVKTKILTQYEGGFAGGVSYTPYIVMNNLLFRGELTDEVLDDIVSTFATIQAENSKDIFASMPAFVFYDGASLQAAVDYYKTLVAENGQEYADSLPYYLIDDAEATPQYVRLYQILKDTILDRQYDSCPEQVIDPAKSYKAILKTEKGDITVNLFADVAPVAVNSFVFLAQNGWFDDITFHRVVPDFVAQSGDPSGLGIGSPGYVFDNEINPDYLFDQPGRLGMANSGEGTNGSQFFITYAEEPDLNGSYTVFGQVESGLDVLAELSPRSVSATEEAEPGSKLISVEIIEE
jgi:cyclophilin family peptidyl-prolyl cis-trans isomerase/protein-disulfide isomerase